MATQRSHDRAQLPDPLTRIEAARREVGHTEVHRSVAQLLVGVFLMLIVGVPLAQLVVDPGFYTTARPTVRSADDPAGQARPRSALRALFDRNRSLLAAIDQVDDLITDDSLVTNVIRPPTQYLLTTLLGTGTAQVHRGTQGWLFYGPDVAYVTGNGFLTPAQLARRATRGDTRGAAEQPDPRPVIFDLHQQLARRGIDLIAMPTPVKPGVHPERLTRRAHGSAGIARNPSYGSFVEELTRRGVLVFDVATELEGMKRVTAEPLYLATDTHWRPETVVLVAERLGTRMTTDALPADAGRSSFLRQLGRNTVYFFVGRHFGLIPYFMPGIVILGWALWRRQTLAVWHLLIGITVAATAAGLLVLLPNTWSGGGGPVGNRYFLSFYPALFFLLPAGRSALPGIIMWVAGALFTAQILVDPFVAAKRTWQHAEQGLFRLLPVELTMVNDLPVRLDQGRSRIPYGSDPTLLLSYLDRNAWRPDPSGIWIAGDARGEIVVRVNPPLSELAVTLRSPIPNTVTVTVDGSRHRAEVQPNTPVSIRIPVQGVYAAGAQNFLLRVETDRGFVPQLRDGRSRDQRYLGVSLELTGLTRPTTASQ